MSLIISVSGTELDQGDKQRLQHDLVSGVILFSRNYVSCQQLKNLTSAIKEQDPNLFICVDHEGGRVQRFREDFTSLPAAATFGQQYAESAADALRAVQQAAQTMLVELRAVGVDFSFVPCLDLDYGCSAVIGDRSYGREPERVIVLARQMIETLHAQGMPVIGKHFPGHGAVSADSHVDLPTDERSWAEILAADASVYRFLAPQLDMIMPAHILFPAVDDRPVTFSRLWLQEKLRGELGYLGLIVSDDLMMAGALQWYPDVVERVNQALWAGCELILLCNNNNAVDEVIARENELEMPASAVEKMNKLRRSLAGFQV